MGTSLPLNGIRVADFSWVGAGPFLTKPLADHGADVVKVESRTRVDPIRSMAPFRDGVKGIERSGYFANRNTSKRSICLDLKRPARSRTRIASHRSQRRRGQQLQPGHHGQARSRIRGGPSGPPRRRIPRDADDGRSRARTGTAADTD